MTPAGGSRIGYDFDMDQYNPLIPAVLTLGPKISVDELPALGFSWHSLSDTDALWKSD
jgi:hypothetical protein